MPSKEEKRRRRELTRAIADRERAEIEAAMPFPRPLLDALLDHLDATIFKGDNNRCDHTLKVTQAFLQESDAWSEEAREWLGNRGGYCDCEVSFNVSDWANGGF
jgi:hypothetical protein